MTKAHALRLAAIAVMAVAIAGVAGTARDAAAALPPGNTVAQWNKIAEDTVVGSGTFLPEGFLYMAYPSAAVYDAVVAIEGGFEPYGPAIDAPGGRRSTRPLSRPPTGHYGPTSRPKRATPPRRRRCTRSAWECARAWTRSTRRPSPRSRRGRPRRTAAQ
jgi:hypothetical protein